VNEHIKSLLLNSRNMFVNGVTESNNKIYIHGSEENLEKFAQLIVQECMSYMKDGDIDFAKFMIKKHFGVQE